MILFFMFLIMFIMIVVFGVMVLFSFIMLFVEFDVSKWALAWLESSGVIGG